MLEGQLNSWMMYIPGVGGSKDAEALKELKGESSEQIFCMQYTCV